MRFVATCSVGLAVVILGGGLTAGEKGRTMLKVGDKAPEFQSVDENGKTWKSSDHVGKKIVVVYFYPADFTGGCTAQACGFRDNMESLSGKGLEVVGVSGDSAATHKLFKAHHKLPFTLLADEKGELAKSFGVPVNKGGMSPTIDENGDKGTAPRGVTIERWTVVIDKGGNLAALYKVANAGGDAKKIGEIVQKLETK
jgi:thioredoxin-dependent peroxiredoxin